MPSSIPPPCPPALALAPPPPPPSAATDPLSLSHPRWELAHAAVAGLAQCGLRDMYAWQGACLQLPGVLAGERNLVFTAPTSAGKSLVADVLVLRRVLGERRKALVVVPYVSIVQERTRFFEKCLAGVRVEAGGGRGRERRWRDIVVAGFHSGAKGRTRWKDLDVAICTIERVCPSISVLLLGGFCGMTTNRDGQANTLVNAAVEDGGIDALGLVVIDELHMVADAGRGFVLEILAAKLLSLGTRVQLVGMSATISVCLPSSDARSLAN